MVTGNPPRNDDHDTSQLILDLSWPNATPTPTPTATPTPTPTPTLTPCPPPWQFVASMPVDVYGAAGASDGTDVYEAGGYSFQSEGRPWTPLTVTIQLPMPGRHWRICRLRHLWGFCCLLPAYQ